MDNKKSDIINKRKYHQPKAVVKGKDGKVINILENNHTKENNFYENNKVPHSILHDDMYDHAIKYKCFSK